MNKVFDNLKQAGEYFHSMELNIILSGSQINTYNYNDNNIFKAPFHSIAQLKNNRQSKEELYEMDWDSAVGLGIILGWGGICAIDIDGCIEPRVLELIYEKLGLPSNYSWTIRSGSQAGYHIIVQCQDMPIEDKSVDTRNLETDVKDLEKQIFGLGLANAYYPFANKRFFSKIEFIWRGNIMLPPSLHVSGNNYSFFHNLPKYKPQNVSFSNLKNLASILCSTKCIDSTQLTYDPDNIEKGNYMSGLRRWEYAKNDTDYLPISPAHRNKNDILISITEKQVVDDKESITNFFIIQLNWLVTNQDGEVLKRETGSYFYYKWGANDTSEYQIDKSVAEKIVKSKKDILRSLLFDITYTNNIYLDSEKDKEFLFQEVHNINLGLDMFTEPGTKYQDYGDNFKKFYYFNCESFSDEIAKQFSELKSAHKTIWKRKNKWADFGSLNSVYDLYCYYHYQKFVLGWIDRENYDSSTDNPPKFMVCNLSDFENKITENPKNYDNHEDLDIEQKTDWSDYNDNLDMDQQSDEFWNQF